MDEHGLLPRCHVDYLRVLGNKEPDGLQKTAASRGTSLIAVVAFQVVDIYHIHAFRRPVSQGAKLTVGILLISAPPNLALALKISSA